MGGKTAPLIERLCDHVRNRGVSLHVPGHKNGRFFYEPLRAAFASVLPFDVTELEHLDDLHAPTGAIKAAQEEAARFYRAKETHFLVGGTTVGNIAMMHALFERGDVVFIQRNSHKSVFHAAEIAGIVPVLIEPEYDEETNMPIGVHEDTLREAIKRYPEAKGVVLTYPNYYGVSLDIKPVIEAAKCARLLVLVDEAHGPHFSLGSPFPPSALTLGADVVVQSAHKMLPSLTMSSYLHVGDTLNAAMRKRIKQSLTMFQSSSPSYLLMASLDGARAYIESLNEEKIDAILAGVEEVKRELAKIKQIDVVDWREKNYYYDPLKLTIKSKTTLTGFELQRLFYDAQLYTEMADEQHVLAVFGLGISPCPNDEIKKLANLLSNYERIDDKKELPIIKGERIAKLDTSPYGRRHRLTKTVPIEKAVGQIAAEAIIPYPPGIPIVLRGEKITERTIETIHRLKEAGATFQGHEKLEAITVFTVEEEDDERVIHHDRRW